ncbi:MAG TPA: crossover junction endodeoxyribonuclease RuvC [Actinomycetota bacterium]
MFERVVVGIDPGTAATGLAAVAERTGAGPVVLAAATVRTGAGTAEPLRLRTLHLAVTEALRLHRPQAVAVERLMWGRNTGSAMGVARATGVVLLAAAQEGIPVTEYGPLEVKMAVTGDGTARKEDVRRMLHRFLKVEGVPSQPDAADAVAVAVCHLHQAPLKAALR